MWKKCERGIWLVNWKKRQIYSPPCGLKACPDCSKRNRKKIALRILRQWSSLEKTHDAWFYTITPNSDAVRGGTSASVMRAGWSKLRKRLSRRYPKSFRWVCVREMTKGAKVYTDAPPFIHMHVIVFIPFDYEPILTERLSAISVQLGIGWKCLVGTKERPDMPLSGQREAYYVAKYATKQLVADEDGNISNMAIPRAISWSQNFGQLEEKRESEGWAVLHADDSSIERVAEYHDCSIKNLHLIKGVISYRGEGEDGS